MKTLIIHPQDPTTRFLCGIYDTIPDKTVIDSGITKERMRKYIQDHDRILMMGHGSPAGLFGVGRFPDLYSYKDQYFTVCILAEEIVSVIPSPS